MAATKAPICRLRHVLDEAEAIRNATHEFGFGKFRDTWVIRRTVAHGLLIISEASKTLPAEPKGTQPTIPWAQTESFGNLLRHEYRDVDPSILWRIIQEDLPRLATAAEQMPANLES
jgi:uncharacterized protein with HEPN domain